MAERDIEDGDLDHEPVKKPALKRITDFLLWFVKDQWFLLGICIVIIISSQVQVPAAQQAIKQKVISYLSGVHLSSV